TSEAQKQFCENISFNPWHSLEEHRPIGGINRARRVVMKDISDFRLQANGVERFEPTGHEVFE
ncbi:MAG: catalase, partial [Gammaproteobacteria bacterium]|nr:catalase [Gammaproteobacteria bacterium]